MYVTLYINGEGLVELRYFFSFSQFVKDMRFLPNPSLLFIVCNSPKNTTVAAVNRLVHYCVMLEMNVERCRRRNALKQKKKQEEPAKSATENDLTS